MARVEVETTGRKVVVDQPEADAGALVDHAERLWALVAACSERPGPATGFHHAPPRWTPDASATNGSAFRRPFSPVKAETEGSGDG